MKQSQIDQLLESSDEQQGKKVRKSKGSNRKKTNKYEEQYAEQYDDFFQSEVQGDQKANVMQKQQSGKHKQAINDKTPKVDSKYEQQSYEQDYLKSQDFQQSQLQQKSIIKPIKSNQQKINDSKPSSKRFSQQQQQQIRDQYQQNLDQPIATQRDQSKIEQQQSQDLVQSEYTQSRIREQEQSHTNNDMDEDIETVKSSNIRSNFICDDDMTEVQSQYVDSFRGDLLKKHQFKKKDDTSKKVKDNAINMKKNKNALLTQANNNNKGIRKDSIKEINTKKSDPVTPQSKLPISKNISTQQWANNINTNQPLSKTVTLNKRQKGNQKQQPNQSQLKQKQEQHQAKLAEIQAQRKAIQDKKMAKVNKEKEIAMKQYEQMKKKQQEKRQKNKKMLEDYKLNKKNVNATGKNTNNQQEMDNLKLTESKIKEIAEEEQKKKLQKAKMKTAQQITLKRKKQQQMVQQKLQQQNKQKAKRLEQEKQRYFQRAANQKQYYEQKKKTALLQKQRIKQNTIGEKEQQKKQTQVPEVRKMRQQIAQMKQKIDEKKKSISDLDEVVKRLKRTLRQKQQVKFSNDEDFSQTKTDRKNDVDIHFVAQFLQAQGLQSQLTPIQKFVSLFSQCKNSSEIFQLLDSDNDQMLTIEQIKQKVISQIITNNPNNQSLSGQNGDDDNYQNFMRQSLGKSSRMNDVIEQVYEVLDKNSDGSVTKQEFTFIIDSELKKIHQYRRLVHDINLKTPIDIQACVIDMKQKIKYMDRKTSQQLGSAELQALQSKYHKYLQKCEQYERRLSIGGNKSNSQQPDQLKVSEETLKQDKLYFLRQQVTKLRVKKENEQKMLSKITLRQAENVKQKNLQLSQKVEQNIRINQEIYKLNIRLQEQQLRFLSRQKMQENRYRFVVKQSQQKQLYEEAVQRAKEYQARILNPAKQVKFANYSNQVKYLAAVIMIQRNFRKRQALRQVESLKQGR